ncbi:activating signal cointegrator 1 [Venturia canescens]|uniref:activating signal cointegrator 1 n=1 Tax=Venturia canescens TaxID=32260 RepID=UPI001C9C1A64|nr:activating signal cointegrator 1 [Venturia canescens]
MENWIQKNLSELLGFPIPLDMAQIIINLENEQDLEKYLETLLDNSNPKHQRFVVELKKRRAANAPISCRNSKFDENNGKAAQKQNDKKKGKSKDKEGTALQEMPKQFEKKKTHFVNLYTPEGKDAQTVLLKGRHKCDCEAKTHTLVNNCINCGRIVCAQERAGPCLFCGSLVCTPNQQQILSNNSKQSNTLYNKLMDQKPAKISDDAIKHRDKLLEFDRNSARRTEVIDDESDYYQTSNSGWLSKSEREKVQKREEELRDKKHESRLTRKVVLDFAGREIVEDLQEFDHVLNAELRESADSMIARIHDDANVCPTVEFDRPTYVPLNLFHLNDNPGSRNLSQKNIHSRIQDKEYLEMMDEGLCLSMHQPYASLLVAGIKTHEGRTWYSSHRGRLWIAAASKIPSTEDISVLENRYRVLINENLKFPSNYPTSCLLGCVTVTDVLPQEEYRRVYPEGESDSPFVLICQDCYELPLKFPIQGKHKIYKLDKKIHQAAMKSLEHSLKVRAK